MSEIPDLQSSVDNRNMSIDRVGVRNIRYPIIVQDRSSGTQNTIAEMDLYVSLPHHHRGTHMSRFLEILNRFHQKTLVDELPAFLCALREALHAEAAFADMRFPYFITRTAPVSGIRSLMPCDCRFRASLKEDFRLVIGVEVPVTTLCPCSRQISRYGAHNQRSIVQVEVTYDGFVWLEELIAMVESVASSGVYPLLKRVDEKHVTEQAYRNPKFVEDIVRDTALLLEADDRITGYRVSSENFESIHNHNAYACIQRGLQE